MFLLILDLYLAPRKPTIGCELLIRTRPESGDFQHTTGKRLLDRKLVNCCKQARVLSSKVIGGDTAML